MCKFRVVHFNTFFYNRQFIKDVFKLVVLFAHMYDGYKYYRLPFL